jgi:hypothetical protein
MHRWPLTPGPRPIYGGLPRFHGSTDLRQNEVRLARMTVPRQDRIAQVRAPHPFRRFRVPVICRGSPPGAPCAQFRSSENQGPNPSLSPPQTQHFPSHPTDSDLARGLVLCVSSARVEFPHLFQHSGAPAGADMRNPSELPRLRLGLFRIRGRRGPTMRPSNPCRGCCNLCGKGALP